MHEQEILDLVDEHDNVIGTIDRADYDRLAKEELGYIRAVEMFIVNSQGKLWVPRRTPDKKIAPNGLDYSAGGHVSTGETYEEAMLKEISEEVNLSLTMDDLKFVRTIGPDVTRYIRKFYVHYSDKTPQYNPSDFSGAEWMTPDEILESLDRGTLAKSSLRESARFMKQWLADQEH